MKPTLFASAILACASVTAYAQDTAPATAPATPAAAPAAAAPASTGTSVKPKSRRVDNCGNVSYRAAAAPTAATGTAKVAPKQKMKECNVE